MEEGKAQQREATEPGRGHQDEGGRDQGIVRDARGQEQPRDKERAQRVSREDRGGDPPGKKGRKGRLSQAHAVGYVTAVCRFNPQITRKNHKKRGGPGAASSVFMHSRYWQM